jgi:hypothetical protein
MRRLAVALVVLAALGGLSAAAPANAQTKPPATRCAGDLPAPVAAKRQAIKDTTARRDWPALGKLTGPGFVWGAHQDGDPVPTWRAAAAKGEDPARPLLAVLDMTCVVTLVDGKTLYVWPSAIAIDWNALTAAEKSALQALYGAKIDQHWLEGRAKGYYVGWSVGIEAQGAWTSFVFGD